MTNPCITWTTYSNSIASKMKIFLDTADTEVIKEHFETGLIDGVTTNPTLIRKSGRDPEDVYQQLADIGIKDISMEVVGTTQPCLTKVCVYLISLVQLLQSNFLVIVMDFVSATN